MLLVTHQLQYAKEADRVCMINRGEVKAMGTLGGDSIEHFGLEFRLEKQIEIPFLF